MVIAFSHGSQPIHFASEQRSKNEICLKKNKHSFKYISGREYGAAMAYEQRPSPETYLENRL